jgi:cytoskeletal protein CcmA (bactofilin family)
MAAKESFSSSASGTTIIGPSILISGNLTGDEDLTVRGRVEGELTLTKTLIVENSGVVKANVAVKNAIVSGVVVGNINATESVELTKDGRMVGDIRAPRVILVDGASFRGRIDMGEVEPGRVNNSSRPTIRPGTTSGKAGAPKPPPAPSRERGGKAEAKPAPPPPPKLESRGSATVGAGAKKRVLVKRKGK